LVDNILLNFGAKEEHLADEFIRRLGDYEEILEKMPEEWPEHLVFQYITFRLFQEGGLASKYLNHVKVRSRSPRELEYLKFQIKHPWRFVFCVIEESPKQDFFLMRDVLSGERFLLFSEGIEEIERASGPMSLYFLLIFYNGECWQTYGNLAYLKAIQPFDVVFFARQLKRSPVSVREIPELIAADPLPFMLLWLYGELPMVLHKRDMIVLVGVEFKPAQFNIKKMEKNFAVEAKPPVYKFSLKYWHKMPHFCSCYYHAEKKSLLVTAGTERGFQKIVQVLADLGYCPPQEPDYRATPLMFTAAREILKRDIEHDPYGKLFTKDPPSEVKGIIAKFNVFLRSLMDALNSGVDYDLQALADEAGIELETAMALEEKILKKMRENGLN